MDTVWREKVGSVSPGNFGFDRKGGRATIQMFINADKLIDFIPDLLGQTQEPSGPKLERNLPKAHPIFPWMYAERISNGVGHGPLPEGPYPANPAIDAPPLEGFQAYQQYLLNVEFQPRPYAILPDDQIGIGSGKWVDEDGTPQTFTYAEEWWRYTDWNTEPQTQVMTAQQGNMVFNAASEPRDYSFSGMPKILRPYGAVKFRWFEIPVSYVDSKKSYICGKLGRINHLDWYGWDKGSLLYTAVTIARYTPPVPLPYTDFDGGGTSAAGKLCDIEFTFELTEPRLGADPAVAPTNKNHVTAGHNLMPYWKDRKYYYVETRLATSITGPTTTTTPGPTTTTTTTPSPLGTGYPIYPSFPFQLLFTNPDA